MREYSKVGRKIIERIVQCDSESTAVGLKAYELFNHSDYYPSVQLRKKAISDYELLFICDVSEKEMSTYYVRDLMRILFFIKKLEDDNYICLYE